MVSQNALSCKVIITVITVVIGIIFVQYVHTALRLRAVIYGNLPVTLNKEKGCLLTVRVGFIKVKVHVR